MTACNYIALAISVAVALAAAVTDLKKGKVFNWLTVPAFVLGFIVNGISSGPKGLLFAAEGVGVAVVVLLLLGIIGRLMGGGDVKLLLAIGALLGPRLFLQAFAFGAIAGGIIALALMLYQGRLAQEMASLGRAVVVRIWGRCPLDAYSSRSTRLPYAIPLAIGVAITALSQLGVVGI